MCDKINNKYWESLGVTRVFETDKHLIWIVERSFDEIETPDGYKMVKKENIKKGKKYFARTFFVNMVPVVAELYINSRTKDVCYYFAGKPLENSKKLILK